MIHVSRIYDVMNRKDNRGHPVPFDLKFVKTSTGSIVAGHGCVCLSSHFRGGTVNIKWPNGEIRKIYIRTLIEFNQNEVII
jgi:hypothetical protein